MQRRLFLAYLGTGVVAISCSAQNAPELSAAEVIQKASAALGSVKSVHFKLTATNGMMAIGDGFAAKSVEGDVLKPDRLKGTAVSSFGNLTVDLGFMVIGSKQYVTNPVTKQWQAMPGANAAPNLLDPNRGAAALLRQISDPKKLANETVDNVDCYHLTGQLAASLLAGLVGATGTSNRLNGELWIATKDFLVRQVHLVGPIAKNEPPQIQRTLDLSNYGESVTIEPPT
ncbi:MAG TPA: LppX_LprAFG lipoprotein [Chloroflexota bacterium]|nr:LppX_LprAFG lipoprotein [Chloroflexota bacterium]